MTAISLANQRVLTAHWRRRYWAETDRNFSTKQHVNTKTFKGNNRSASESLMRKVFRREVHPHTIDGQVPSGEGCYMASRKLPLIQSLPGCLSLSWPLGAAACNIKCGHTFFKADMPDGSSLTKLEDEVCWQKLLGKQEMPAQHFPLPS